MKFPLPLEIIKMKNEELAKKVGKRIVHLRESKGWSQSDLARACMKDRQSLERIENGKTNPTLFTFHEIATALEVSLAELFKIS
jgi:putative transcriptional regulator